MLFKKVKDHTNYEFKKKTGKILMMKTCHSSLSSNILQVLSVLF